MLFVKYRKKKYDGSNVEIGVKDVYEIPELRRMLKDSFMIENPAVRFSERRAGRLMEDMPQADVEAETEIIGILTDLWEDNDGHSRMEENVLVILSRVFQKYVEAMQENERLREILAGDDDLSFEDEDELPFG